MNVKQRFMIRVRWILHRWRVGLVCRDLHPTHYCLLPIPFLLALATAAAGCSPRTPAAGPGTPKAGNVVAPPPVEFPLIEVSADWGIDFVHNPGPPSFFFPGIVGSGVALLDYDQDGRLDVFLRNGTSGPPHAAGQPDSPPTPSRLYHQEADGKFTDVTEAAGLTAVSYGMGVAVGDVNNDGYPDIYAVNFLGDRLYLNQRDGKFVDVTTSAGIDNDEWGSSATFFDFDRDGRLDIFVVNYVDYSRPKPCSLSNGREDFCNPAEFLPSRGRLYRNVTAIEAAQTDPSAVRFEDVTAPSGIGSQRGPSLGVRAGDFNEDGWPDIFVANDGRADFMWINQQDGRFRELGIPLGAAYNSLGRPTASMGIAEGDVDRDGHFDLIVTNLRGESNTLFHKSQAVFDDVTAAAGLKPASFPHTGFGIAFADADHDGNLDLVVANGHVYQAIDRPVVRPTSASAGDPAAARQFWAAYGDTKQLLLGNRTGQFRDVSPQTGAFAQRPDVSRGLAVGDMDGDGDLDFVFSNIAGRAQVFRNDLPKRGHWLMLRVVDPGHGGRDAIGAVVHVQAGTERWMRRVQPGSSYQSSDDPRIHFGLGEGDHIDAITVHWPDGSLEPERFDGGEVDTVRTIRRGTGHQD
jgi:hypothetical protein